MKNVIVLVYPGDMSTPCATTSKNTGMDPSDRQICGKLRRMGYSVVPQSAERALEKDDEVGLVIISPGIKLAAMPVPWLHRLAQLDTPVIVMDCHQFDNVYPGT